MNKAIIAGNLTREPELKMSKTGTSICNFSIATNSSYTDSAGQKQENVEYHNCVAFAHLANSISKYMSKGSGILVEGRLQTRSWDDSGSGKKMYRTEIIVANAQFGAKATGSSPTQPKTSTKPIELSTPAPIEREMNQMASGVIEYPEEDINPADIPF